MIKSATSYPISQIFDIASDVVYTIPRYQREYTWNKNQWETLFDDIQENDGGYFFGSIICINTTDDTLKIPNLEVIDGQQRLTTISLLFAALYHSLKAHKDQLDEDQQAEQNNLKRKLVLRGDKDQFRVTPQIQNTNREDYCAILSKVGATNHQFDKPLNAGNRKIFRAFRYFESRINEMAAKEENSLDAIISFLEKINQACLVKIEVGSHADAYTLFESLNNRGTPLTAIDLIKNKLLAKLERTEPGNIDTYFGVWRNLLESIGDNYGVQERFFRHYYNAFKESLNAPFRSVDGKKRDPLGPVATRSNLTQIYERLIDQDAKKHLEDIRNAGRLYSLMLNRRDAEDEWTSLEKPLLDLDRIQGSPSYLLMLYLLVKQDDLDISIEDLRKIINLLVSFFVRRNLTDTPPTRDLTRLFMTTISKISSLSGDEVVQTIKKDLLTVSADDKFFHDKLKGAIYEENLGVTRFILCALEEQSMTREKQIDLWKREGNTFVWTIEHIFPQGNNIPSEWVDMIADGNTEKAKEIQESHAHKLGNLTISGFNSTLGNKSFIEKKDRTDKKGREVGYNNGLQLNAELATAKTWNVEKIDARTSNLATQILNLFKLS